MSDWEYIHVSPAELLTRLHQFTIVKQQANGGHVTFMITVKEFATPPPGQRVRFYAEADKELNQNTASFLPCGWGSSLFLALGDCVKLIQNFPYEGS
jgi:hypothetical protein